MKKSGFTKIALIVLSLTLILGAVIGISVSAEDTEKGIIAHNIVYGEKVAVAFAVNATLEEAESIKIAYYWEGEEENLKNATLLDTTVSENLYKKDGASYPVFVTSGLPAKELGKVAHATVYTGDAPAEDAVWETYSVAEYLFVRLYIDNFTAKTEADGLDYNRKLLYENLLNYGANAQMVFGHNTDKLITDYELAYTTNPLVTLNGANYAFGYDLTVEADYIGEGDIEKWTVTDTRGNESESQSATISVDGVAKIDVVLGVHECADEDNDHVCNTCGEICSECANNNATEDHLCDICGKVVDECKDENTDGKCDTCKIYLFEVDSMSSSDNISFTNIAANSGTDCSTATGTVTLNGKRPDAYTKGAWLYLTTDPTNAVNKVLAVNTVSASSMTDDAISDVIFTPDVQVANGDLIVLEYDFYVDGCTNNKNSMKFVYNYENNTTTRANATYATSAGVRMIADADGSLRWALDTWVRVRLVCDNTNGKIYTYLSTDSGATYTLCETVSEYTADAGDIKSLGFTYVGYGVASTQYYDNIVCVQTDATTYGITFE